jgi:hypothetical protein
MSKKNDVNPDYYKLRGRGRINEVIVEKRPAPVTSEKGKPTRRTGGSARSTAPRERSAPERPT